MLRPKLDELLLGRLHSEGSWLWRPACLACVFLWPELNHHPCSEQLFQRLCACFYNMALAAPDYQRDILQFLADCEGGFARRIYERTVRLYQEEFHLFPTATSRSALKC